MIQTKELTKYENHDLNNLTKVLEQDYDIAYGQTYAMSEIRKAVIDQQPSFVRLGKRLSGQTVFVVGETKNSLIATKEGELFELPDKELKKSWTGEAVIVLDKKTPLLKAEIVENLETKEPEIKDFVIFPFERDNWDKEKSEIKSTAKDQILRINKLDSQYLPTHPVIVVFQKPSDEFVKKGVRAANAGAEIQIYDASDPYTEFLHELGHIYWSTRLTDEEKAQFGELHKKLDKKNMPAIFMANWDFEDSEEVFATVYYWKLKGLITNPGYSLILEEQYLEGYELLNKVFSRVESSICEMQKAKKYENEVSQLWKNNEGNISRWINQITGAPSISYIKGRGLIKAQLPDVDIQSFEMPVGVTHSLLGNYKNRKWITIHKGILKGKVIVLKEDYIDVDYMRTKKNYDRIPFCKTIKHGDKLYSKISYKSSKLIAKAVIDNLNSVPGEPLVTLAKSQQPPKPLTLIQRIRGFLQGL